MEWCAMQVGNFLNMQVREARACKACRSKGIPSKKS